MWKAIRFAGVAALTIAGTLGLSVGSAMAAPRTGPRAYTCAGGDFASGNLVDIPSGTYASIKVTGACDVPADAVINVTGSVYVATGAALDAQSAPSTITVRRDVIAGPGAILGLGCQPPSYTHNSGHQCTVEPDGHSTITVNGNITALGANTVLLNGIKVKGSVTLLGGGGEIPWSIKNTKIGRNLTVAGLTVDWLGVLFNKIGGNTTLLYITVTDTDPVPRVFVVENTIGRNLICAGLAPGVTGGAAPGEVNIVGRHSLGQCAHLTDETGGS